MSDMLTVLLLFLKLDLLRAVLSLRDVDKWNNSRQLLQFPDYANGDCSVHDQVMTVNVGYYQSWSVWRAEDCHPVAPDEIDVVANGYTHLAYSFASIDSNYRLEPWLSDYMGEVPRYEQFNSLKQKYPGLKTLIAIGGWTFNNPGETEYRFSDASMTAENRAIFAQSILDFMVLYGFDGIDLDWEFPGDTTHGGRQGDKENYALLVQEIRSVFDADGKDYVITVATPVGISRIEQGFDLLELQKGVDFFHFMNYNTFTHFSQDHIIGASTDMPFIFKSIKYFLDAGLKPNKIVLGLAAYGRTYNLMDPNCATAGCLFTSGGIGGCAGDEGVMPNFTIDEYLDNGNYKSKYYNPKSGTMELVVDDTLFISYDNIKTYKIKHEYAKLACFRGMMWWSSDMKKKPIFMATNLAPTVIIIASTVNPSSSPSFIAEVTASPFTSSPLSPVYTHTPTPSSSPSLVTNTPLSSAPETQAPVKAFTPAPITSQPASTAPDTIFPIPPDKYAISLLPSMISTIQSSNPPSQGPMDLIFFSSSPVTTDMPLPMPTPIIDAPYIPVYIGTDTIQVVATPIPISASSPITPSISSSDTITAPIPSTTPFRNPTHIAPVPAPIPQSEITDVPILIFGSHGSPVDRKTLGPVAITDSSTTLISSSTTLNTPSVGALSPAPFPKCVLTSLIASLGVCLLLIA
jgi:chitinase